MEGYKDGIFKISKDEIRAKDLFEMAKERLELVITAIPKNLTYKLLEEYYEIATQLITGIMYLEGYKTLSHIELINYLKRYKEFGQLDIDLLDNMRKFRHGTVYYGRKESGNFFINHEADIKNIIKKLIDYTKSKIN